MAILSSSRDCLQSVELNSPREEVIRICLYLSVFADSRMVIAMCFACSSELPVLFVYTILPNLAIEVLDESFLV